MLVMPRGKKFSSSCVGHTAGVNLLQVGTIWGHVTILDRFRGCVGEIEQGSLGLLSTSI